jgi:F-type H+-transporting ATPase subunit alpha
MIVDSFYKNLKDWKEVGYVEKLWDFIAEVNGLPNVKLGEIVVLESGQVGQVINLRKDAAEVLLFSKEPTRVGTKVSRSGKKLTLEIDLSILGRTIDGMGDYLDQPVGEKEQGVLMSTDVTPMGIVMREKVTKQLITGVALIDLMIPLGKGQRELFIGDRKTGKSQVLLQTVVNQARSGTVCIYAAIGKKQSEINRIEQFLKEAKVWGQCVLVAASVQDSPGEIFSCPNTAMTVAEFFRDHGRDVLLVLDDLSTHAKFYRELSLLLRKFPGRDSYPGDIFHLHSKLLERAGNFMIGHKEAAITCLPVAETVQGDITGYIQTNLMSMTDGHIYFDNELFLKGRRPAINPFISVTRVGHQTQSQLGREAGRILLDLLSGYERTQSFLRFGAELGESSKQIITMGDRAMSFFDQPMKSVVPHSMQIVVLALLVSGIWNGKGMTKMIKAYETDSNLERAINDMARNSQNMKEVIEKVRVNSDMLMKIFE